MEQHLLDKEEVLKQVESYDNGLSQEEADKRIEKYGKNKLTESKKIPLAMRFLNQLKEPMIIILMVAALVSGVTAVLEGESLADVFIIMFVVILNAVLGVLQESKAEKAIDALKAMTSATSKVLRNGTVHNVKSEDIVVGDIILLEAGDAVPADARIIECASLKVEEAALTGESVSVNKQVETLKSKDGNAVSLGDRKNMLYMGSEVVYGRGRAVVVATGMKTEVGKIADAIIRTVDSQTPLQKKLSQLSKMLTKLVIGICLFIFVFGIITEGTFTRDIVLDRFMVAVSLAVAAIPEGLATVVTIVLSIGVTKMAKRNAVIRKLTAVETLGCTQIICSDKTGTLTQNKMTAVESFGDQKDILAKAMALCTDAELDENNEAVGEPTQCAMVNFALSLGISKNELKKAEPRIAEVPFDSVRKLMTTVHSVGGGYIQYTTGAPDEVMKKCSTALLGGKSVPFDENVRNVIAAENKRMADKALRVIGAACRIYKEMPQVSAEMETEMMFLGFIGMIDPIRPEVLDAIQRCKNAGIRPIMITGDHKNTASAIAMQLGIIESPEEAITGAELDLIPDDEFERVIEKYSVYARVQPENKVRIVEGWKKREKVVAMTGDGVNDAPAIKGADIGIGMGITGTDVTKNVADMVLSDDNFATIVDAVEEGRRIYANIQKAIQFLLASNLSEVLSIFIATLLGFTILNPVHILWINLITDTFPALALGMEKGEKDIMKRKPRSPKEGMFAGGMGIDIAYQGAVVTLLTLLSYFIGKARFAGTGSEAVAGMTMAFLTMSLSEVFHSVNLRSRRKSLFSMLKEQNYYLLAAMAGALILSTIIVFVPALANIFGFADISVVDYFIALGLAFLMIPIVEAVKMLQRSLNK